MKKLTVIIALMLVVTIGGVYATWNYAQGSVAKVDKYLDGSTKITDKVVTTAKGTISVDTSAVEIIIDDANNDHVAELSVTGDIVITFTPNEGADANVATNGIVLQYQMSNTGLTYLGNPIFTYNTAVVQLNGGAATKSVTIPATDLGIALYDAGLTLPDVATYEAFKAQLHTGSLCFTVSEVVAP